MCARSIDGAGAEWVLSSCPTGGKDATTGVYCGTRRVTAWPLTAWAQQQGKVFKIGILSQLGASFGGTWRELNRVKGSSDGSKLIYDLHGSTSSDIHR